MANINIYKNRPMLFFALSSSLVDRPVGHSRGHETTPLNSVLSFAPSDVEAYVQSLQILFDRICSGVPWPACRSHPFFWEVPDCCLLCSVMVVVLCSVMVVGRVCTGNVAKETKPSLHYQFRCTILSGLSSYFHVDGVLCVRHLEYALQASLSKSSNFWRVMSVVIQVSQPYRRTGTMYTLYSHTFVTVLMEDLQMLRFRDVKHDLAISIRRKISDSPTPRTFS